MKLDARTKIILVIFTSFTYGMRLTILENAVLVLGLSLLFWKAENGYNESDSLFYFLSVVLYYIFTSMADAFVTCIDLYMASAFGRTSITDDDKWLRTHSWLAEMAPARGISFDVGSNVSFPTCH
ncbi:hypothetical protein PCN95_00815 [Streptococcus suis]|uniref:hypothetical protein n=1 Tax=Streptococcus suis TaxID=1307 RepID=UPI001FF2F712|nr:hypothetical protein [Streptococcus suis]MDN2958804.1 hypothetical protein [Streptococcus suis]